MHLTVYWLSKPWTGPFIDRNGHHSSENRITAVHANALNLCEILDWNDFTSMQENLSGSMSFSVGFVMCTNQPGGGGRRKVGWSAPTCHGFENLNVTNSHVGL